MLSVRGPSKTLMPARTRTNTQILGNADNITNDVSHFKINQHCEYCNDFNLIIALDSQFQQYFVLCKYESAKTDASIAI